MLLLILWRLVTACSILLGLYMLYFGAVALFGFKKRRAVPRTAPKTKFACVVAARNEEAVIANLVHSLRRQNYPPELFDIIVAPNNCTDDTAGAAQAAGATLYAPRGEIHSKGDVLREVVDHVVLAGGYDAMCVFDADNLVHPDFLARMNDAVCAGHVAVQGFRDSKNPEQSAISGCYSICYWMLNRFYNSARSALGLSALVNGSGFTATAGLLRELGGWNTVTMTEDYEFSAQCALRGHRVAFQPEAVIYDEQPLTFRQSWRQRRRWTTGSLQGLQVYGGLLFRETVLRRSAVCFDMTMTFLTPFVPLASTVLGIAGAALVLVGHGVAFGGILLSGLRAAALMLGVGAAGTVLGTSFAAALTVVLKKGSLRGVIKGVATFWLFALSHMALTLLSFVKKERTWRPIAHTNTARIEDLTA